MTENEVRAIVRDEVEEQLLKVGGILDHCRQVSFNLMRGMFETQARQTLESFGDKSGGLH